MSSAMQRIGQGLGKGAVAYGMSLIEEQRQERLIELREASSNRVADRQFAAAAAQDKTTRDAKKADAKVVAEQSATTATELENLRQKNRIALETKRQERPGKASTTKDPKTYSFTSTTADGVESKVMVTGTGKNKVTEVFNSETGEWIEQTKKTAANANIRKAEKQYIKDLKAATTPVKEMLYKANPWVGTLPLQGYKSEGDLEEAAKDTYVKFGPKAANDFINGRVTADNKPIGQQKAAAPQEPAPQRTPEPVAQTALPTPVLTPTPTEIADGGDARMQKFNAMLESTLAKNPNADIKQLLTALQASPVGKTYADLIDARLNPQVANNNH